jgi:hypothetical protein
MEEIGDVSPGPIVGWPSIRRKQQDAVKKTERKLRWVVLGDAHNAAVAGQITED